MKTQQILIIGGNAGIRQSLKEAAEEFSLAVRTAYSLENGLEIIKKDVIGIVFLDISLPGILRALEDITEHHPATDVILVSEHKWAVFAAEALKSGATDLVMKQFSAQTFRERLKRLLAENQMP